MIFIEIKHISLCKSNDLFITNKRSWTLLLDHVAGPCAFIVSLKLWKYNFMQKSWCM